MIREGMLRVVGWGEVVVVDIVGIGSEVMVVSEGVAVLWLGVAVWCRVSWLLLET